MHTQGRNDAPAVEEDEGRRGGGGEIKRERGIEGERRSPPSSSSLSALEEM